MNNPLGGDFGSPAALLHLLLDGRPRTRAEIVAETGLARTTVRARLDSLLAAGLVAAALSRAEHDPCASPASRRT